ncbi:POU domain class 2-associating factor 1 [Ornithorhynchus anatinus]|uniref:POU class 2 homeobox associating factor 1 n=1 Tax=Ornithorhynchus anatinus TaxID=9258 RepID=A0A6I8PHT3_ORNAN|nr:POU domain class 2-associating factor 1 [Ornithorhynchus anatinus]
MLWQKSSAPEQPPAQPQHPPPPRPYQGVRVKEPVKELLRRKRGHASGGVATATAVVLPHPPLTTFSAVGPLCLEAEEPLVGMPEDGAPLCASWLAPPGPAALQPLGPWASYPDFVLPDAAVSCPYAADMFVQPVGSGYTVVGPSSLLSCGPQPLLPNFTTRGAVPAGGAQLEASDSQMPLTYFPWAQPLSALPAAPLQYQPPAPCPPLPGAPFVPLPVALSEPAPQAPEGAAGPGEAGRAAGPVPVEKLLLEEEEQDTYVLSHPLSVEGF